MESPFVNDPFSMVYQAFQNLYPEKDLTKVTIWWEPNEIKSEDGSCCVGMTHFANDGDITIFISIRIPVADAVETLAHELAHVAVGAGEDHGEVWENAFDAIHAEFDRIGNEMFGVDSGVPVEVSDGKGGLDPDSYVKDGENE